MWRIKDKKPFGNQLHGADWRIYINLPDDFLNVLNLHG